MDTSDFLADAPADAILLVDDMPENIRLVYQFLKQHQLPVLIAQDGESALNIARKESLSLILLDVMMPGMDGFSLCRHLKDDARTRDIPVIFMTALSDTQHKLQGFAAGGVDYLTKPVEEEELLARVNTHLRLFRLQQALTDKNRELEESVARHQAMLDNSLVGIAFVDEHHCFVEVNEQWAVIAGYYPGQLSGTCVCALYPTSLQYQQMQEEAYPRLCAGEIYETEQHLRRADGTLFWGRLRGKAVHAGVPAQGFIWNLEDISRSKTDADDLRLAAKVFENIGEALMVCNPDSRIIRINPAFSHLTGYRDSEVLGKKPSCLSSGYHDKAFYQDLWATLKKHGQWQGELWDKHKNGTIYPVLATITTVRRPDSQVSHYVAVMTDITERKRAEAELSYQAHYDKLTGLPNRRLFFDHFHKALHHAITQNEQVALLYADLDGFKQINDHCSHEIGDKVLEQVATRLKEHLREGDMAARWGGDEFVVLLTGIKQEEQAFNIACRLIEQIHCQVDCNGGECLPLSVSIGVAFAPGDANNSEDLLRYADQAMYCAKQAGKNTYCRVGNNYCAFKNHAADSRAEIPILRFDKNT
jgi:diguanylate cyclase (GGDEF)-like protein/PAS domain S-box-containing protein